MNPSPTTSTCTQAQGYLSENTQLRIHRHAYTHSLHNMPPAWTGTHTYIEQSYLFIQICPHGRPHPPTHTLARTNAYIHTQEGYHTPVGECVPCAHASQRSASTSSSTQRWKTGGGVCLPATEGGCSGRGSRALRKPTQKRVTANSSSSNPTATRVLPPRTPIDTPTHTAQEQTGMYACKYV